MGQFAYVVKDAVGLHARPAGMLVKMVKESDSAVTIQKGDKEVDASKLMALMSLGVKCGDEIVISADDEKVLEELKQFCEENL